MSTTRYNGTRRCAPREQRIHDKLTVSEKKHSHLVANDKKKSTKIVSCWPQRVLDKHSCVKYYYSSLQRNFEFRKESF